MWSSERAELRGRVDNPNQNINPFRADGKLHFAILSEGQLIPDRQRKFHFAVLYEGHLYHGFEATKLFFRIAQTEVSEADLRARRGRAGLLTAEGKLAVVKEYLETEATLEEIGQKIKTSRQYVWSVVDDILRRYWRHCSPKTQRLFPIGSLEFAKPKSLKSRLRQSQTKGGLSIRAAEALKAGKSLEEMQQEFGVSRARLLAKRSILRSWGVELPFLTTPGENKDLREKLLNPRLNDAEAQLLLNRVRHYFYENYRQSEEGVLVPLFKVGIAAGFHVRTGNLDYLRKSLQKSGIPLGEFVEIKKQKGRRIYRVKISFIAKQHLSRAVEALKQDPDLLRFTTALVKKITGPDCDAPSLTEFMFGKSFNPVTLLIRELGFPVSGTSKFKSDDYIDRDCPVPIFSYRRLYKYLAEQKGLLAEYIKRRAMQLGLKPKHS